MLVAVTVRDTLLLRWPVAPSAYGTFPLFACRELHWHEDVKVIVRVLLLETSTRVFYAMHTVYVPKIHSWQNPGFSTVWANLMSCMPEAEYLLRARNAEQRASRRQGQESTVVFDTEMVSGIGLNSLRMLWFWLYGVSLVSLLLFAGLMCLRRGFVLHGLLSSPRGSVVGIAYMYYEYIRARLLFRGRRHTGEIDRSAESITKQALPRRNRLPNILRPSPPPPLSG